jgi:hypothetical protein
MIASRREAEAKVVAMRNAAASASCDHGYVHGLYMPEGNAD